ncbi:hypothetical protein [Spiroplasma floricola]|uniref:Lipoprotein n=1 Tax=Spiroplasma floricola 23-6 TaxID=1336749 RepID=A0A2K8SEE9_9MOLU|nr:hypothetical protein [Spiroplasma floricola]AUB31819.1 hypothetical protein SFLOR_v1c07710 [Spiroplasma floricola 23-6]
MKKLCSFLGVISLTVVSSSTVIACNGGLDMSLNYTDEEKIVSIYNLTEDQLVKNGVQINSLMTDADIDKVVEALGLKELINQNPNGAVLKKSLGVYIMSNQFLNEISTKVPGYGWISNKLSWQSQWAIKDLVKDKNTSLAFYNNVSGWMSEKDKDWSLSVTFLNEDLLGWNGVDQPTYARVNINRKLSANKDGEVQEDKSNKEATHRNDNSSNTLNSQDAFLDEKNPNKGMIYRGYANSSSLFKLENILSTQSSKVPTGFFNYSPSATDFINNTIVNLDFTNMVLQNSQDEIEKALNEYLLQKPIFLSEGMSTDQVDTIVKNQIYAILLKNSIDRRNLVDNDGKPLFIEEQLKEADIIVQSMITKLETNIKNVLANNPSINTQLLNQFTNMIDKIKKDNNEFISVNKDNFISVFRNIIDDSRNNDDPESGQFNFSVEWLNANLFKNKNQDNIALANQTHYLDFGYDSSYKFKVFYWSKTTPITGNGKQWYSPDDKKNEDEYIADKGFRNVFLSQRLLDRAYSQKTYNVLSKYQASSSIELDVLGLKDSKVNATEDELEKIMLDKLKEAIALNSTTNFANKNEPVADSWRIYHLLALINKYSNEKIYEIFGKDQNDKLEIHNRNVSLDFSNKGLNSNTDWAKADDDIAFYELLESKKINLITNDYKESSESVVRENIFNNEIQVLWDFSQKQYIFAGTVNTFGVAKDQKIDDINTWWKDKERSYGQFEYKIAVEDKWKELLMNYWKKHVSQNKNNPDYNSSLKSQK